MYCVLIVEHRSMLDALEYKTTTNDTRATPSVWQIRGGRMLKILFRRWENTMSFFQWCASPVPSTVTAPPLIHPPPLQLSSESPKIAAPPQTRTTSHGSTIPTGCPVAHELLHGCWMCAGWVKTFKRAKLDLWVWDLVPFTMCAARIVS